MTEANVHTIEISNEEANYRIRLGEAVQNLQKNEDFKLLILEELFKNVPARYALLKATDAMREQPLQLQAMDDTITAVGALNEYFRNTVKTANSILQDIRDAKEYEAEQGE